MKGKLKIAVIAVAASALAITTLYLWMSAEQKSRLDRLVFEKIDMTKVQDGTYTGHAGTGFVNVKVEVSVEDHKIKRITLTEHDNGFGKKAETIIDDMVRMNTYEVDGVSGATHSSQTIKSAVCDALLKGLPEG